MQNISSKVECLSALCLNSIKEPIKKLILLTANDPSFQSLANSFRMLKSVTRNVDDFANCLWSKFQERKKSANNEQYSENQKKSLTDNNTNNETSKRCNKPVYNKNKRYLATLLLTMLDESDCSITANQSKKQDDSCLTASGDRSSRFKYGLIIIKNSNGSFSKLLKRESSQSLIKVMAAQNSKKKSQPEETVQAFDYRIQRAGKIVNRRFGILAARTKKRLPLRSETIKTVTKSARALNTFNKPILLTGDVK